MFIKLLHLVVLFWNVRSAFILKGCLVAGFPRVDQLRRASWAADAGCLAATRSSASHVFSKHVLIFTVFVFIKTAFSTYDDLRMTFTPDWIMAAIRARVDTWTHEDMPGRVWFPGPGKDTTMDSKFPDQLFPHFYLDGPPEVKSKHSYGGWGSYERVFAVSAGPVRRYTS